VIRILLLLSLFFISQIRKSLISFIYFFVGNSCLELFTSFAIILIFIVSLCNCFKINFSIL
jgi:hypothetical protein